MIDSPSPAPASRRLTCPAAALLIGLLLAVGLMLAPPRWAAAARGHVLAWLRPGQLTVLTVRGRVGRLLALAAAHFDTAARLADAELRCQRLADENRQLAGELALAATRRPGPGHSTGP